MYRNDEIFSNVHFFSVANPFIFKVKKLSQISYGNPDNVDQRQLETYIHQAKIDKGKSVLLIPQTVSGDLMPDSFWHDIVVELKELGLSVFINVGPGETEIQGTERIDAKLEYIPAIAKVMGYTITIQTGIGDLLHFCQVPCSMFWNIGPKFLENDIHPICGDDYYSELIERYKREGKVPVPAVQWNSYNKELVGKDPYVFPNCYMDCFDTDEKIKGLKEQLIRDTKQALGIV